MHSLQKLVLVCVPTAAPTSGISGTAQLQHKRLRLRAVLMLQGAVIVAQLLPLLRFLQATAHHASKPPEPELLPTAEDFGSPPVPTDTAGPAADAGIDPESAASESTSAAGAGLAAAASAGGAVEAAVPEAGVAAGAGAGAGADGPDLAPVAVTGAVQGAQEGSGESEVEDLDEDEEEYMDEEMDDEGIAGAQVHAASAGIGICLHIRLFAVDGSIGLFWTCLPSAFGLTVYKRCCCNLQFVT